MFDRSSLVVAGAGGFARELLDVVDAVNRAACGTQFDVVGVVDPHPTALNLQRLAARGIRYLGTDDEWLASGERMQFVVGVGDPTTRLRIVERFSANGLSGTTLVHPLAGIGSMTRLGEGSVVCAGVQISTNVTLGRHVHLNPNATIGHDAVLHDYVSVNPGAVVSGGTELRTGVMLGAGAVILEGLTVGEHSVVGAGSCVTRDVAPSVIVSGVPARDHDRRRGP